MAASDTFIRLHDGMPDHPKVDGLSDAAFRALVEVWCWCSRHLTDGQVPKATWEKRWTAKARRDLIEAGLAEPQGDGGVAMHDYLEHQRSAEEVEALRQQRRDAGRAGGLAKARRGASKPPSKPPSEPLSKSLQDTDTEEREFPLTPTAAAVGEPVDKPPANSRAHGTNPRSLRDADCIIAKREHDLATFARHWSCYDVDPETIEAQAAQVFDDPADRILAAQMWADTRSSDRNPMKEMM